MATEPTMVIVGEESAPYTEEDNNEEIVVVEEQSVLTDSPQDGIEDLRKLLAERDAQIKLRDQEATHYKNTVAESERRRIAAENNARTASNRAANADREASERQYEAISNGLVAETANIDRLKADLIRAQTDGDFNTSANLQIELGRSAARLETLQQGKSSYEEAKRNQPAAVPQQPRVQETGDQFNSRAWNTQEAEAVLSSYTPSTAAWLRAHPQYFSDPQYRKQVQGAHSILEGKGTRPDTDEYFRGVESLIGSRQAATEAEPVTQVAAPTREGAAKPVVKTAPAAPPSRNVPGSGGTPSNPTQIKLSPAQQEMARIMFPKTKSTDEDPLVTYAKHLQAGKKAGQVGDNRITWSSAF